MKTSHEPGIAARLLSHLEAIDPFCWTGQITRMTGLVIRSHGPACAVGEFCEIHPGGGRSIPAQVIGFEEDDVLLMALEEADGLQAGDVVIARGHDATVEVGRGLLGRVLDTFGRPIDGGPSIRPEARYRLHQAPVSPMKRAPIQNPLPTGIKAIDGLLTCGTGQRIGIFGGSGVGKSTLLGSMVRNSRADVCVVALIGERNREVREFIDHDLGPQGLQRAVVVVATSDRPAPLRVQAAFTACAISEFFRDQGARVLLVMDSVTRFAMAQREIGLAAGEPPSQKGYTPSVFQLLPRVFERAGHFARGSITGFYTVLVEGDDFNEPISDAVRSILDGHIVLSRKLAARGHYPPIDVLRSVSRLANRLGTVAHNQSAISIREALAAYEATEDLIQLGAYVAGSNPHLDACIREMQSIEDFLRQDSASGAQYEETVDPMPGISRRLDA
jgi:flagellum-specific ATP synthase